MIIGITGWFASGKDTACEYLEERGFIKISLSDIIREYCSKEGQEHSRENLQKMGNLLREKNGPDFLALEALRRMQKNADSDYVIPSIRQPAEVNVFRRDPSFQLWEIYAPAKVRYQRLINRARTEDEVNMSYDEFIQKEELEKSSDPNSQQVDKVIQMADYKIDNSKDKKSLLILVDKELEAIYATAKSKVKIKNPKR